MAIITSLFRPIAQQSQARLIGWSVARRVCLLGNQLIIGLGLTGLGLTGLGLTGLGLTGLGLIGVSLTGLGPMGLDSRGLGLTGLDSRGVSLTGFTLIGFAPQPAHAQGVSPQELSPQEVSTRRASTRRAPAAQGTVQEGALPAALAQKSSAQKGSTRKGATQRGSTQKGSTQPAAPSNASPPLSPPPPRASSLGASSLEGAPPRDSPPRDSPEGSPPGGSPPQGVPPQGPRDRESIIRSQIEALKDYTESREHLDSIKNRFASLEQDAAQPCRRLRVGKRELRIVIRMPIFNDYNSYPIKGSWVERWLLNRCNEIIRHNLLFQARAEALPLSRVLVPGTTRIPPTKQREVLMRTITTAKNNVRNCLTARLIDTEITDDQTRRSDIEDMDSILKAAAEWIETWWVMVCDKRIPIRLRAWTDGKGSLDFTLISEDQLD